MRRSSACASRDLEQLLADDRVDRGLVAEQRAQLLDLFDQVVVLGLDLVGLHRGEALEAQVEDRLGLFARELELGHQSFAGCVRVGDARISATTSSMFPTAISRPARM